MLRPKTWCVFTFALAAAPLLLFAAMVAIVDPFFYYRKPSGMIPYAMDFPLETNPGIVKHFEYDSLIVGSSMTWHFKPSYFYKRLGNNAVKAPYSGATSKNINILLGIALQNNPNLRTIYWGLDLPALKQNPERTRDPLPCYMYDINHLTEVRYLLNKNALLQIMRSFLGAVRGESSTTFDEYMIPKSGIVSQYRVRLSVASVQRAKPSDLALHDAITLAQENLEQNILPLIEAYPDTHFVIFYPPYSILYWCLNFHEHELAILEHSIERLLPYDNVSLFFFQADREIVTNLYNYKDYSHYTPEINDYMVDCFKDGTHRLTAENYRGELVKMRDLAENFDYGLFFGESNPFIGEESAERYFEKMSDPRYVSFILARTDAPISAGDIFGEGCARFGLEDGAKRHGFAAVARAGRAVFRESGDAAISFDGTIDGRAVSLVSEKRGEGNFIELIMDGVKYTTNQAGVNVVVYDTKLRRVMDNIALDIADHRISRQ